MALAGVRLGFWLPSSPRASPYLRTPGTVYSMRPALAGNLPSSLLPTFVLPPAVLRFFSASHVYIPPLRGRCSLSSLYKWCLTHAFFLSSPVVLHRPRLRHPSATAARFPVLPDIPQMPDTLRNQSRNTKEKLSRPIPCNEYQPANQPTSRQRRAQPSASEAQRPLDTTNYSPPSPPRSVGHTSTHTQLVNITNVHRICVADASAPIVWSVTCILPPNPLIHLPLVHVSTSLDVHESSFSATLVSAYSSP